MPKGELITIQQAIRLAKKGRWDLTKSFHSQSTAGRVSDLLAIADLCKYRKP